MSTDKTEREHLFGWYRPKERRRRSAREKNLRENGFLLEEDRDTDINESSKHKPPVSIPLDFETAVAGLLGVDPKKPEKADKKKGMQS